MTKYFLIFTLLFLSACTVNRRTQPQSEPRASFRTDYQSKDYDVESDENTSSASHRLAESGETVSDVSSDWFYGPGLGKTLIATAGSILFWPYGVYVVGNAAANLAGYDGLYVTDLLGDEPRAAWLEGYETVASAPGRFTSVATDQDYREGVDLLDPNYKPTTGE